ncbi:EAL domain-containing protein [Jannaschia aquimarina]|uniref:Cph2_2 protein n=1 Tax=Jannaschia aquimarina TaxID=935700 RepID=A0A0D1EHP1_9RHOB|nr:EAL domain-containing protein [Jannaschia aquimarina]KIT16391.1 Phytochrome-like protein cph2 [Jannaschia aquimarina]SNT05473.1 diguanylate cyclase/phosphodiesterase [Jannaschia aquimarina]
MSDAPLPGSSRIKVGRPLSQRIGRAFDTVLGSDWILTLPFLAAAAWLVKLHGLAMALALTLPALLVAARVRNGARSRNVPAATSILRSDQARIVVEDALERAADQGKQTGVLLMRICGVSMSSGDWGDQAEGRVMDALARRAASAMRAGDGVFRINEDRIAVVLEPAQRLDLDVMLSMADRLQAAVEEPVSVDGLTIRPISRVGLCTEAMAPSRTSSALMDAADRALRAADRQEPGAVRAFTPELRQQVETGNRLTRQVASALSADEIRPWFQPQIDARNGAVTGFEALARWYHPDLGILAPNAFLSAVEASGHNADLGIAILRCAADAINRWDEAGIDVPTVGVNFSPEELRDPRLADRIIWEIDRHGISPARITIEILETVALEGADATIRRNIDALRDSGFRLDLDDFGTGSAAIGNISGFGVHRIKIDRSFIDPLADGEEPRRIVAGILRLASEMGIETVAEGVELPEQIRILTDLGCDHLQGYAIAKPMPLEDTLSWARKHGASTDLRHVPVKGHA